VAKLPKIPRSRAKDENKEQSLFQQQRKLIGQTVFRYIVFFMGAVALIYALFTLISGSALFVPSSTNGILDSVEQGSSYTWNSQTVRLVNLTGQQQEQDAARGATIDLERNKFQAQVVGVLPQRTLFVSDSKLAIRLSEEQQLEGDSWDLVTDFCSGAESVDASTLQMPSADEIKAADPSVETDQGTVFGQRAWVLSFTATPDIVKRLLWLPFFDQALEGFPSERPWVLSDFERQAIEAGDFKTIDGQVWINRSDQRKIQQIDLRIEINGGSKYRFLAQLVPAADDADALAETSLTQPEC